jgi:NAD(P)-dependent dehydrogenase (short-subunit alcohol dehydrogenase family)
MTSQRLKFGSFCSAAIGGALEFHDFIIFVFFAQVIGKWFFAATAADWIRQVCTQRGRLYGRRTSNSDTIRNETNGFVTDFRRLRGKMTLENKRVVILGGTSGIGFSVAEASLLQGATVVVVSSNRSKIDGALARLSHSKVDGRMAHLSDERAVESLFRKLGAFDHLVFTAGGSTLQGSINETSLTDAKNFFGVRFWGVFLAVRYASASIQPEGSNVLTSSTLPKVSVPGLAIGASISGAVEVLAAPLAVELAPIRVNVAAPRIIRSELWNRLPEEQRENYFAVRSKALPLGRVGKPSDVAEAYLSFMRGPFTTGQTLVVDGGMLLV